MSSHQRDPGANEEHVELRSTFYNQHVENKIRQGLPKPKRNGILIFEEVKVQGGVAWNSKNNQIIGIAMLSKDLPALHDIYAALDEDHKICETHYVLQFVWRDLTSKFDKGDTSNSAYDHATLLYLKAKKGSSLTKKL